MRAYNRRINEKGVVLVLALLIMAILMLLTLTLSQSMASYLRSFASVRQKTQTYYTSITGAEQLKDYLWNNNCIPPNWCDGLGVAGVPNNSSFQDYSQPVTGSLSPTFGNATYSIFVKDNQDGDSTYLSDNDQIIIASIESVDAVTNTRTTVEAMLIFNQDIADCNKGTYDGQAGQGSRKANKACGKGLTDDATVRQNI